MRIRTVEIENDFVAFAPHRALYLERSVTETVITNVIFEIDWFFADGLADQLFHCPVITQKQLIHCRDEYVLTEPVADFADSQLCNATRRDNCMQVGLVPFRHAALEHGNLENVLLEFAFAVQLDWRQAESFLENRCCIGRQ